MIVNWKLAEEEISGSGMSMKLIDGKWCMLRQGEDTIFYDAPTKEALISAYFHEDMEDFIEEDISINYDMAIDNIQEFTGMSISYSNYHKAWVATMDDNVYHSANTREELVHEILGDEVNDYKYEAVEKIYPRTLQSLPLLNEPATMQDRRLCLRQLEENKWCVCTYHEQDDEFVQGHYFNTWVDAIEYYQGEIARYTAHWQELVDKFYEMEGA